jgi:hypothetical protein
MLSKIEIFRHLKSIPDKSGGFKKVESIRKNYPEIYRGIEDFNFPENYTFQQKLWHFLQDDFTIHRCECGNNLHFIDFRRGYRTYCSTDCPCSINHNKETVKLAQISSRKKESRKKAVSTIIRKNGGKFWSEENLKRLKSPYRNNTERCDKIRKALERNRPLMNKKIRETIKRNITDFTAVSGKPIKGCSSRIEMSFYKYLIDRFGFENVEPQYFDKERYPFNCDFYLPEYDLFVEIQGSWTHGGHPFNPENTDDLNKLDLWRSKNSRYYDNAIYTWTDLDMRKRDVAEENHINRLEIFSSDITETIRIFEKSI